VNLEQELRSLEIAFPPEPDVRAAVLARLERPRRRWRLVAAVAAVAALGATLAIPQTRAAILRLLEIGGVRIEQTETQPAAERSPFVGGRRVTQAEAADEVAFPLARPPRGAKVFLDRTIPGGMVSYVFSRYVLSQWEGQQTPYVEKLVGPRGELREVDVGGSRGIWVTGAPHVVFFVDRHGEPREQTRRLAGNVLIWEQGTTTYRLEGARSLAEALAIARNL
jgi:hypothetical protein